MKRQLRMAIERVSRDLVFKRRLPSQFGKRPFFVTPGAALAYWRFDARTYDDFLYPLVERFVKRGDEVWDVGANVGLFALTAGAKGGRVLAFEPDVTLSSLIRRSADLAENHDLQIDVLSAAISDRVDLAELAIAQRGRATNHLNTVQGSTVTGGVRHEVTVLTLTLDWLLARRQPPKLIKIDVEGAEALVFAGAQAVLARARPIIVCELFSRNMDGIAKLFAENDYVLFDAMHTSGELRPTDTPVTNTLAIPAEKVGGV